MPKEKNNFFENERIWRYLTDFWSLAIFALLIIDCNYQNSYDFLIGPFAAIYIGVLALYASTKEFNRWHKLHAGRHPGEIYIIVWSLFVFSLGVLDILLKGKYHLPSEIIATYITVLGVFAITQKSKNLYFRKKN